MESGSSRSMEKVHSLETEFVAHARECAEREKQRQKFERRAEEYFEKLDQKITVNAQSSENALREIELARAGEEAIRKGNYTYFCHDVRYSAIVSSLHSKRLHSMSDKERRKRRRAELARRNKFQKFLDNELRELAYDTKRRMRFWFWTWFCVIVGGISRIRFYEQFVLDYPLGYRNSDCR